MKSLTLHSMDDQLAGEIRRKSKEQSISMNELAKRILAEGLGLKISATPPHREDFASLCGSWSKEEAEAFNRNIIDFETVCEEDWQ